MKNLVVATGARVSVFLTSLIVSVQVSAAEISVFNRPLETILDTIWGTPGRLLAIIAIAALGLSAFTGRISGARAGLIILGIILIWYAPEIFDAFV